MPHDFLRAVEATLFASAEPLTPEEIGIHVGEGNVRAALARLALTGRWWVASA